MVHPTCPEFSLNFKFQVPGFNNLTIEFKIHFYVVILTQKHGFDIKYH